MASLGSQTVAAFGQNFGQNVALRFSDFFPKGQKPKSTLATKSWPYFGPNSRFEQTSYQALWKLKNHPKLRAKIYSI